MKRTVIGLAGCIFASLPIVATAETLTNESIITLHKLGLGVDVLIAKIETEPNEFKMDTGSLGRLLEAGIPQEVMAKMINPNKGRAAAPSSVPSSGSLHVATQQQAGVASGEATNFAGTPCQGLRAGIYFEGPDEPERIRGRKASSEGGSSGAITAITRNIVSQKSYVFLNGLRASQQISGRAQNFLFCFEEAEAGLSHETEGSSTPEDFVFSQLELRPKKNLRRLQIGKSNFWAGNRSGAKLTSLVQFSVEELADGVYRVTPQGSMTTGEYAFYVSSSTSRGSLSFFGASVAETAGRFYDFGYNG